MPKPCPQYCTVFVTFAGLCLTIASGPALAHKDDTQLWISQSLIYTPDKQTTLTFDLSERFREDRIGHDQYLSRISLDRRIAPGVEIGAGFVWQGAGPQNEYRPHQQILFTHGPLLARLRLEERIIDGAGGTSWRFRQRVQFQLPLDRDRKWQGVLAGETFFHLNATSRDRKTGLAMVRTQIGLRRMLGKHLNLLILYQRQQQLVDGGEDVVNHEPVLHLTYRL